jgi:NAD(P)H-quinone oxidoreductase subunit 2
VVSIYYYISVIKMMVVKEPQEASDVVKAYPSISWNVAGLPALRTALVGCVIVTAVGGILSSPLFTWASQTVAGTPLLQAALG